MKNLKTEDYQTEFLLRIWKPKYLENIIQTLFGKKFYVY